MEDKIIYLLKTGYPLYKLSKLINMSVEEIRDKYGKYRRKSNKSIITYSENRITDLNIYTIMKRDNFSCRSCGYKGEWKDRVLCVHHIDLSGKSIIQNNKEENLVTLCSSCHSLYHTNLKRNKNHKLIFKPIETIKEDTSMRIFPMFNEEE